MSTYKEEVEIRFNDIHFMTYETITLSFKLPFHLSFSLVHMDSSTSLLMHQLQSNCKEYKIYKSCIKLFNLSNVI